MSAKIETRNQVSAELERKTPIITTSMANVIYQGPPGEDGKDYILTDGDKQEIANLIDLNNYYTKAEVDDAIAGIQFPQFAAEFYVLSSELTEEDKIFLEEYYRHFKEHNEFKLMSIYMGTNTSLLQFDGVIENYWQLDGTDPGIFLLSNDNVYNVTFNADGSFKAIELKIIDNPEVDLTNYYTKGETDAAIQAAAPDLTGYALKTDIPDHSQYALKTEIPDTTGFTTMAAVEEKGYQTEEQVLALIAEHGGGGTLPASEEGEF